MVEHTILPYCVLGVWINTRVPSLVSYRRCTVLGPLPLDSYHHWTHTVLVLLLNPYRRMDSRALFWLEKFYPHAGRLLHGTHSTVDCAVTAAFEVQTLNWRVCRSSCDKRVLLPALPFVRETLWETKNSLVEPAKERLASARMATFIWIHFVVFKNLDETAWSPIVRLIARAADKMRATF